ncbi:Yip1 family protein [Streptomyces sp. NPDC005727]|uniref:Yip1 family protein n=1 Tax=unclassified Streptomyces TaxID=2593676 RepID=UPI0033D7907C
MSIRPWVVVEAPDGRGLRRVTIGNDTVGSAWSQRELRRILDRLGYPELDLADPATVCWRGGDSGTWPDRALQRRVTGVLMAAGLLASAVLNGLIGWPDASGAQTFAQRLTGVLFVLSGLVQLAAAVAVFDHWGRRQSRISGAVVLLGVLISLATDSLLVLMWLEETEYTPYMLAFMPLWCWSVWALWLLVRQRAWQGVPHPRTFAAGVFVPAVFTALSLAYSTMFQPAVAPIRLTLKTEFGTARADRTLPFVQIPLKLSVKNTGDFSVHVVIDDLSVYGRTAKYSERGTSTTETWRKSFDENDEEAELHVDQPSFTLISSERFYSPGQVIEGGQEDTLEHVFQIPRSAKYDVLYAMAQITYIKTDRGRIDADEFSKPHPSWKKSEGRFYCSAENPCQPQLVHLARLRSDNNLVDVTRGARYVLAIWAPERTPVYSISSYHFQSKGIIFSQEKRERDRYGVATISAHSEASMAELMKSIPSPSPP